MSGLWLVSYIALWALLLIVAVALFSVMRNLGVIYESLATGGQGVARPTKLVTGEALPDLTLQTLTGDTVDLAAFQGMKTAFSVVSPQCAPCLGFLHDIATGRAVVDPLDPSVRRRVVVSVGDIPATSAFAGRVPLPEGLPLLVDVSNGIADKWGVISTPTTVIVDEQLRVVRHLLSTPAPGLVNT